MVSKHIATESTIAPLRKGEVAWGLLPHSLDPGAAVEFHVLRDGYRTTSDVSGEVISATVLSCKASALQGEWEAQFEAAKPRG